VGHRALGEVREVNGGIGAVSVLAVGASWIQPGRLCLSTCLSAHRFAPFARTHRGCAGLEQIGMAEAGSVVQLAGMRCDPHPTMHHAYAMERGAWPTRPNGVGYPKEKPTKTKTKTKSR